MPQPDVLIGATHHRNSGLFSDHYLNVTLPRREDWQTLAVAARPVLDAVKSIYAAYTPSDNEAQIEKDLIRPVLAALGHTFEVQAPLATSDGTKRPTLTDLFGIIDAGSPPLKVATFNGGLFDPARHPFLARHTVGDAHLQRAIDKLARVKGQFVDYRDLAEQHLGTIYEGLLEYQLRSDDCEDGWTVALLNDKGERHATGSYYTPDYIVKYMVDATLGPVLRAAVEGARDDATKVAQVLTVNVLDPAMGSGHFLVEATAYIARFLVELGVRESEGGDEADAFVEEVRKRRPKAAGALTPATLKALKSGYAEQAMPLRRRYAEAAALERALSDLVNAAYGLTPTEIDLLWATAPPRMPIGRPAGAPPSP